MRHNSLICGMPILVGWFALVAIVLFIGVGPKGAQSERTGERMSVHHSMLPVDVDQAAGHANSSHTLACAVVCAGAQPPNAVQTPLLRLRLLPSNAEQEDTAEVDLHRTNPAERPPEINPKV